MGNKTRRRASADGKIVHLKAHAGVLDVQLLTQEAQFHFGKRGGFTGPAGYLLPIITRTEGDPYRQYRSRIHRVNRTLHGLSARLGIAPPLTTYVARHSWASNAYRIGVPVAVISEALGHESEKTTRIYLSAMDSSRMDEANAALIRVLQESERV